jgi:anhydro-N-acetylmuramic acid kinase
LRDGKQAFDLNGRWARRGKVSQALLGQMMTHPFIRRVPPKSTGREEFGEAFTRQFMTRAHRLRLREADIVATATAFTAETIAEAYRRFVFPRLTGKMSSRLQIIVGGGGARNPALRQMLAQRIGIGEMLTHEELGIDSSAKEALAFAVLGYETLRGRPSNLPNVTGARHPVVLGKVVCGGG